MSPRKKYYHTKPEAIRAAKEFNRNTALVQVYKIPKGTRKAGWFAMYDYLDLLVVSQ